MFQDNNENNDFENLDELETMDTNNQIVEVENVTVKDNNTEIKEEKMDTVLEPKKEKLTEKIKKFWDKLNTKGKVLFISLFVILFALIGFLVYFLLKDKKEEVIIEEPAEVIVEEENYRYENGELVFLNLNKEEIGRYTCENQNESICYVAYFSNEDNFDVERRVYEDNTPVKLRSSIINDTFVFIHDSGNDEVKLYNMKQNQVVGTYLLVKKVDTNKMILKQTNNLYGMVEFSANEMLNRLDFFYDYLGYIPNDKNVFVSKQNDTSYLIDTSGKALSKGITGNVKNYNENYIKVQGDDGKYSVYTYNNQNVFGEVFDYVEIYNDYAALVTDTRLNLRFYDHNKLNEDAILLKTRDFVPTSVFDSNKVLKESKKSFEITENEGVITVSVYDNQNENQTIIQKYEGELSKNLRNLNYFDGKLYFYSNTDKTELLGVYSCANKNEVKANTKELSNCKLAKDTVLEDNDYEVPGNVGIIPIFNERFVFLEDDGQIVLYDLKKNTVLGKYKTVNTYSYTGTDDITFTNTSDLQVVLQNNSGNYGVVKITQDEVIGHIGFNYSEMEKLNECYVAKDANGYVLLANSNGASKTSAIRYKIRNYNDKYVKVKRDDGKYYIYEYNNEKSINEDGYKYVELYDEYFAAVDNNNKLSVYLYTDLYSNLISGGETIQLNSTDYYGNGELAFRISGNKITIKGSGSTYDIIIPVPEEE